MFQREWAPSLFQMNTRLRKLKQLRMGIAATSVGFLPIYYSLSSRLLKKDGGMIWKHERIYFNDFNTRPLV